MADEAAPGLREAYSREVEARLRQGARTACWLAITLIPGFALLDLVLFPDLLVPLLALRASCTAAIGTILWLLERPSGARRADLLTFALACVIVVMIDAMIAQTGGIESRYWPGLSLVLLALSVLMVWDAVWPIAVTAVIVASYVAVVFLAGPRPSVADLTNNLSFLVSSGIIAAVGSVRASRLQWLEFSQRAALEEAVRHKSDFMAKMSHELRTPLHAIIGYTDMLREHATMPADTGELLDRIRSRGLFLNRMIADLLDFAKVEAGALRIRQDRVDVVDVVEQAVATLRPLGARKGLTLAVTPAVHLPAIASDAHRVEQIVLNLVANAIKFTEQGGVEVAILLMRGTPAGLSPLAADEPWPATKPALAILVSDTGIGIAPDDLPKLARDFHQAAGVSTKHGGTGLGLSISRRLAALLGGAIFVTSRPGAGSTFAVLLPLPAAEAAAAATQRAA
jgi:signal transduction histidine kinase